MIAIKDMSEMPKSCTEVIEKQSDGGWIEASIKRCPLYNICEHRDSIKSNFKPDDCPLVEIVSCCKDCKYWEFNENASILYGYCNNLETETGEDFYCGDAERRE